MVIPQDTKAKQISGTVESHHQTITTLVVNPKYCIIHGLTTLTDALTDAPTAQSDAQRQSIVALRYASKSWAAPNEKPDPAVPIPRPTPAQNRHAMKILEINVKQTPIT